MGLRKKINSQKIKNLRKNIIFSSIKNIPSSPRKVRLLANLIKSMNVEKAIYILKYSKIYSSKYLEKLLKSAIYNWKIKNKYKKEYNLYIKNVIVENYRMLKRIRPSPQGRANKIRKRSSNIHMILENYKNKK